MPGGDAHADQVDDPLVDGAQGVDQGQALHVVTLSAIGEALPMVALDLRGRGFSETTRPGTYGWDAPAHDVLAAAEQLGARRFGIVGWSMGAFVGMAAAAQAPECVLMVRAARPLLETEVGRQVGQAQHQGGSLSIHTVCARRALRKRVKRAFCAGRALTTAARVE